MFLTTSIFSDKMLGLDLHLMHVELIKTLRDLQKQFGMKILWKKQFALQKADPGLRTKRVPVHQGSWTVLAKVGGGYPRCRECWWAQFKPYQVATGPNNSYLKV
jgi:hypothetical protein